MPKISKITRREDSIERRLSEFQIVALDNFTIAAGWTRESPPPRLGFGPADIGCVVMLPGDIRGAHDIKSNSRKRPMPQRAKFNTRPALPPVPKTAMREALSPRHVHHIGNPERSMFCCSLRRKLSG